MAQSHLEEMIEQLSSRGSDLKSHCDSISFAVASAIQKMVGTPESGLFVKMGADGTPTKMIDYVAENVVFSQLKDIGINVKVISEEIGEVIIGEEPDYFIHLDPLDGTFNAIRGIPFYSISIYISKGDYHFGYVCDLACNHRFYAEIGRGAYAEPGMRINVSKTSDLKDFSISAYTLRPNTSRIVGIGDKVRRIRTLGSSSLEMALVASGKLDAFIDVRGMLRVVDVAAGKLILEEAGGVVTDARGRTLHLNKKMWQKTDLIGSNGLHHIELLQLIGGDVH